MLKKYFIGIITTTLNKDIFKKFKFDDRYQIIGDFDLNIRLAAKWKVSCIQDPVAIARIHGQNDSLLNKSQVINELKIWCNEMKKNPIFSSKSGLNRLSLEILYLEIMQAISVNGFR